MTYSFSPARLLLEIVVLVFLFDFATSKCLRASYDYGREIALIQPLTSLYDTVPITSAVDIVNGAYFTATGEDAWKTQGGTITGLEDTDTEGFIITLNTQNEIEIILTHDGPCKAGSDIYCPGSVPGSGAHNASCTNTCDQDGVATRFDVELKACCTGYNCTVCADGRDGFVELLWPSTAKNLFTTNVSDQTVTCSQYGVTDPETSYLWNSTLSRGTFTVYNQGQMGTFAKGNSGMVLGPFSYDESWCLDVEYSFIWNGNNDRTTPGIEYFQFVSETQSKTANQPQITQITKIPRQKFGNRLRICNLPCSNVCAQYTSCGACTYNPDCGWCPSNNYCFAKSPTDPSAPRDLADCPSGFQGNGCTSCGCGLRTTCSDCLAADGCGWCVEQGLCLPGSAKAPSACAGECTTWFTGTSSQFPSQCLLPNLNTTSTLNDDVISSSLFDNNNKPGWLVYDSPTASSRPSEWLVVELAITQKGSITENAGTPASQGSWLYLYDGVVEKWTSNQFNWTMQTRDPNYLGVSFRYIDSNNFYALEWANADPLVCDYTPDRPPYRVQRLKKKENGVYTTLISESIGFDYNYTYALFVQVFETFNFNNGLDATQINVWVNDTHMWSIADNSSSRPLWGTFALTVSNNSFAQFDNIYVRPLSVPLSRGLNQWFAGTQTTHFSIDFSPTDFGLNPGDLFFFYIILTAKSNNASQTFVTCDNFNLVLFSSNTTNVPPYRRTAQTTLPLTHLTVWDTNLVADRYQLSIQNPLSANRYNVFSLVVDVIKPTTADPLSQTVINAPIGAGGFWSASTGFSFSPSSVTFTLTIPPHPDSYLTFTVKQSALPTPNYLGDIVQNYPPSSDSTTDTLVYTYPQRDLSYFMSFFLNSTDPSGTLTPITPTISFSYPRPNISSVSPTSLPTSGGSLTIVGTDFGAQNNTVDVGNTSCVPTKWTSTSIVCTLPAGTGANLLVIVTSFSGVSPQQIFFSYVGPSISSVTSSPNFGTEGGKTVTITGLNFGVSIPAVSVFIGPNPCPVITVADNTLTCTLPSGSGAYVPVTLTVSGQQASAAYLTYDAPNINSVYPTSGPSVNTVITLHGINFGAAPLQSTFDPLCSVPANCAGITFVKVGNQACTDMGETTNRHKQVVCKLPPGVGTNQQIQIVVSGQFSNAVSFSYNAPILTGISPNHGSTQGTTVSLTGANFGAGLRSDTVVRVIDYSGLTQLATNLVYVDDSTMYAFIPPGVGTNLSVTITIASQVSQPVLFSYDAPTITSYSPLNPPTEGGSFTITGTNLGTIANIDRTSVTVGDQACYHDGNIWNHTMFTCTAQPGQGQGQVAITIRDITALASTPLQYAAPVISSITPVTATTNAGTYLTISGSNFGSTNLGPVNVTVGSYNCNIIPAQSTHREIVCALPLGQGTNLDITVTVSEASTMATQKFSFATPTVTSWTPQHGPTVGGTPIEVDGVNFGSSATISLGAYPCVAQGQSNIAVNVLSGPGEGTGLPLRVTLEGQDIVGPGTWSYDDPVITNISPLTTPTAGGQVTLTGNNFGTGAIGPYAIIYGSTVIPGPFVSHNHTTVVFEMPPGTGSVTGIKFRINNAQTSADSGFTFTYAGPAISSITGCPSECNGNDELLITGTNFGPSYQAVTVTIQSNLGNVYSCTATGGGDTTITCLSPSIPERGRNLTLTLTVAGMSAQISGIDYAGPTITPNSLQADCTGATTSSLTLTKASEETFCFSVTGVSSTTDLQVGLATTLSTTVGFFPLTINSLNGNTLSVKTSDGAGAGLHLLLIYNQQYAVGTDVINYPTPVIIGNTMSSTLGGATSTSLTGSSAGMLIFFNVYFLPRLYENWKLVSVTAASAGNPTVECYNPQIYSDTGAGDGEFIALLPADTRTISCVMPAGTGTGYKFTVTANGNPSSEGTDTFGYIVDYPVINEILLDSPDGGCVATANGLENCSTSGGALVRLMSPVSDSFCNSNPTCSMLVLIGSKQIPVNTPYLDSEAQFVLPAGTGLNKPLLLLRDRMLSRSSWNVSYASATVTRIFANSPPCQPSGQSIVCETSSTQAAFTVTVTGTNFGDANALVFIGGKLCTNVVHSQPHTELTCLLSPDRFTGVVSVLNYGGLMSSGTDVTVSWRGCRAGTFRSQDPSATLDCQDCPPGTYADVEGSTSCKPCLSGKFASGPGATLCAICPPDTFSFADFATPNVGPIKCTFCPSGSKPRAQADACEKCSPGTSFDTIQGCKPCDQGKYATTSGSLTCTDCPPGTFAQISGSVSCSLCAPGLYMNISGNPTCFACPPGTYAAGTGATTCLACPPGSVSNAAAASCTQCPSGQYQSGTVCQDCVAGTYSKQVSSGNKFIGVTSCLKCLPGQTSSAAAGSCVFCEKGKYANVSGANTCSDCPAGQYSSTVGQSSCSLCPPGYYSSLPGAVNCLPCNAGSFAATSGSGTCTACSAGSSQAQPGASSCDLCLPGYYTQRDGLLSCLACAPGSFAAKPNSTGCTICPVGTYAASGAVACMNASSGFSAPTAGQNIPLQCDPGFVSSQGGASACVACSPGKYASPLRDVCLDCIPGYAAPQNGSVSCTACGAGTFANISGMASCLPCDPGFYQTYQAGSFCLPCTPGYSAASGSSVCTQCFSGKFAFGFGAPLCASCDSGYYQSDKGQSNCLPCVNGTFIFESGQATCESCEPGQFSVAGNDSCAPCPAGYYSNVGQLAKCLPCESGSYMPAAGQSACVKCPLGKYAEQAALTACQDCPPGYYGPQEGLNGCLPCPSGQYASNNGSQFCQQCLSGTYMPDQNASICTSCSPGYHQALPGQTACEQCEIGKFAQGTGLAACVECAPGSYSDKPGFQACTPCEQGKYQPLTKATACIECPIGEQAPAYGSPNCIVCEEGKYSSTPGTQTCRDCDAGKYTPSKNSTTCLFCDPGYFATGKGSAACTPCAETQYQPEGGSVVCIPCEKNQISNSEMTACLCKPGTYAVLNAFGNASDCVPCPTGADCAVAGLNLTTLLAKSGWWRQATNTSKFYQCLVPRNCLGGSESTCDNHRTGPICAICKPGTREDSEGRCSPCPTQRSANAAATAFIVIAIAVAVWVIFYLIIRSDRRLEAAASREDETEYLADIAGTPATLNVGPEARNDVIMLPPPVENKQQAESVPEETNETISGDTEPTEAGGMIIGTPDEQQVGDVPSLPDLASPRAGHMRAPSKADVSHVDPTTGTSVKIARPNLTYKIKIVLSFFQIASGVVTVIDIAWPRAFKSFISAFNIFNLDFLQWSSVDCLTTVDYYLTFTVVTITPPCLLFLIVAIYLAPAYLNKTWTPQQKFIEIRSRQRNSWKLFLFSMFLIYPKVSSTVLQMYVCRTVEGVSYMVADFNLRCYNDRWNRYLPGNVLAILAYPVGIPATFLALLLMHRQTFFTSGTRVKLGFLYDGYAKDTWWFELVDMLHKLFLTSILAFIPSYAQSAVGMCIAILYGIVILLRTPYYRKGDDRLHLFAQTEIFMLFLAGHIFYSFGSPDSASDAAMSAFLIIVFLGFLAFFIAQSANIISKILKLAWARRKAEFEKRQFEEEKELTKQQQEMAHLNMFALSGNILVETQMQKEDESEADAVAPLEARRVPRNTKKPVPETLSPLPDYPVASLVPQVADNELPPEGPHTVVRQVNNRDQAGRQSMAIMIARRGSQLATQRGSVGQRGRNESQVIPKSAPLDPSTVPFVSSTGDGMQ